jgi:hypothetical protein
MSIWNKILVGVIFVVTVAFFYMATRTLKTHQHWRELAGKFQRMVEDTKEENRRLIEGDLEATEDAEKGIRQLRLELQKILIDRGRVWYNCSPQQNAQTTQTGQVAVATDLPDPHGIANKTVLYAFEEADFEQGGHYLGEFKVTAVDNQKVVLEPSLKLESGSAELQRLAASKGPWTLYEIMPIDDYEVFADLEKAELEKLLPANSLADYVNDGQPGTWKDVDDWGVKGTLYDDQGNPLVDADGNRLAGARGTYRRWLRDYEALFKTYYMQQTILFDQAEALRQDNKYLGAAVAQAELQERFREKEKTQLQADKTKYVRERDAVETHRKALQANVDAVRASVAEIMEYNKETAHQIAEIQSEATRRIDAQTRSMAQAGVGAN